MSGFGLYGDLPPASKEEVAAAAAAAAAAEEEDDAQKSSKEDADQPKKQLGTGGLYGNLPTAKENENPEETTAPSATVAAAPAEAPAAETPAVEKKEAPTSGWSMSKSKAAMFMPPPRRKVAMMPPVRKTPLATNAKPNEQVKLSSANDAKPANAAPSPAPTKPSGTFLIANEYDPAKPNDFDLWKRERTRKRREEELRIAREKEEEERKEREKRRRLEEEERRKAKEAEAPPNLAISGDEAYRRRAMLSNPVQAPPPDTNPLNISGDEAFRRRAAMSAVPPPAALSAPPDEPEKEEEPQGSAASRMMAKMGWKAGQGLGANNQGIAAPLVATKAQGGNQGIISVATPLVPAEETKSKSRKKGAPTRVLLLRNMVGRGEVDDDLQAETMEECAKYGQVEQVAIFEVQDPDFNEKESVRIFVRFNNQASSIKACLDMDGRFFGGRHVHACFYNEARFLRNDLKPDPSEPTFEQ